MLEQFLKANKVIRHHGFEGAGMTAITPTAGVDCANFQECTFIVGFEAIVATGVQSIKVQQSDDDSTYADLAGSSISIADDGDNKLYIVSIKEPRKRYLKCIVSRATANSTVNGIFAILSGARKKPVTEDATVGSSESHASPAEGTA